MRTISITMTAAVVAALGCGKDDGGAPAAKPSEPSAPAAEPAPSPAPVDPPADGVYFLLDKDGGMVALEDGSLRRVAEGQELRHAIPRADGGLWLRAGDGIVAYLGGDRLEPVPDSTGLWPQLATAEGLWATSRDGVGRWDGAAWEVTTFQELGDRSRVSGDVLVAGPDGTVYLTTATKLHRWNGAGWTSIPLPVSGKEDIEDVAVAGETPYVVTDLRLFRVTNDAPVELAKLPKQSYPELVVASDGALHVAARDVRRLDGDALVPIPGTKYARDLTTGADGVLWATDAEGKAILRIGPDRKVRRIPAKGSLAFPLDTVANPEVDGGGRLWVVTDFGVAHVDPAGEQVTQWTVGTSPAFGRRAARIVARGAAVTPPDLGPPKTIRIQGRFVDDAGAPVAGVVFELCKGASGVFYGRSPCDGKTFSRRAVSGADGTFTVEDVPLGGWNPSYGHPGSDTWVIPRMSGCCGGLAPGEAYQAGDLRIGQKPGRKRR